MNNISKINKKLDEGLLDGLAVSTFARQREDQLNLTIPYTNEYAVTLVKYGNPQNIRTMEDLKNRKMAIHRGILYIENLADSIEGVEKVYVDSALEVVKAIISGKADFAIYMRNTLYEAQKEGLLNYIDFAFPVGEAIPLGFGIRKDWPELVSIINKVLNDLTEAEKREIQTRWVVPMQYNRSESSRIEMTRQEQAFLARGIPIRICVNRNWKPIEYLDNQGKYQGLIKDYLELLKRKT